MHSTVELDEFQKKLAKLPVIKVGSELRDITLTTRKVLAAIKNYETLGDFAKLEEVLDGSIIDEYHNLNMAFKTLRTLNGSSNVTVNLRSLGNSADPNAIAEFEGGEDIIL